VAHVYDGALLTLCSSLYTSLSTEISIAVFPILAILGVYVRRKTREQSEPPEKWDVLGFFVKFIIGQIFSIFLLPKILTYFGLF